jgi:hypothetical protein
MRSADGIELRGIDIRGYEDDDGNVLIDKVVFETRGEPNGATENQITFKPRKQEVTNHEVGGVEVSESNSVRLSPVDFKEKFEGIQEAKEALEAGKAVTLSCDYEVYTDDSGTAWAHSAVGIELKAENPDDADE